MYQNNIVTVEGRNNVLETLRSTRNIKKLIIETTAQGEKIAEIQKLARNRAIQVEFKDRYQMNKLSQSDAHEGVVAYADRIYTKTFKQFAGPNKSKKDVCIVVLRGLVHDQNLGAIIRTAAASGVDCIALTKEKKDFYINATVERIAEGASNYITFIKESFFSLLKNLDKEGYKIIVVENNGTVDYFEEDYSGKIALVFGNESETLRTKNIGNVVKIPMVAKISSLNVSVSAGVIFYERFKQLNQNGKTN